MLTLPLEADDTQPPEILSATLKYHYTVRHEKGLGEADRSPTRQTAGLKQELLELDLTLDQKRWRPPRISVGEEWSMLRGSTTPFGQVHQERLSEEEQCARISTVTKKKDLAQNLYDAYAAALTGYSPDDDDLKVLKKHHDDLQLAMREVSKLQLCRLPSCKKHKIRNFKSQIKRNAAHRNNHEHDNDGFTIFSKKLIAKVTYAKNPQHLVETKNSFDKLKPHHNQMDHSFPFEYTNGHFDIAVFKRTTHSHQRFSAPRH
ncbi:hypothetical protein CDAR_373921 [Caerostris darwini]|uniref:Uncharacterized protein n=1 Tax=Caerostris darwini TaxID=1538125 RepID=A0AAV4VE21_9ARAC|nr:hypothetical protein CDAR_373921 [Caerostris darwini]